MFKRFVLGNFLGLIKTKIYSVIYIISNPVIDSADFRAGIITESNIFLK